MRNDDHTTKSVRTSPKSDNITDVSSYVPPYSEDRTTFPLACSEVSRTQSETIQSDTANTQDDFWMTDFQTCTT